MNLNLFLPKVISFQSLAENLSILLWKNKRIIFHSDLTLSCYRKKYSSCHYSFLNFWITTIGLYKHFEVRGSRPQVFCEKGVLRNLVKFTGKHLCQSLCACNFIKKETLAQVFSSEFCEISKNIFFYRTPLVENTSKHLEVKSFEK